MTQPGQASGRFLIRMEPGLHRALRKAAQAAGTSLNDFCVRKLAAPGYGGVEPAARVVARAAALLGSDLVGVVAFGSWARGEATVESDVDVLIVIRPEARLTRALYDKWDVSPVRWDARLVEPNFVRLAPDAGQAGGLWAEVAVDGLVLFERGFEVSRKLGEIRARIAAGEIVRRWSNGHPYWVAA